MVEAKKSGKKSVLKALRLKPGVQKSGDIDQAGKVSNVIGKWKMKANNKSKENLNSLTPAPEIKKTPVIKNLQRLVIRREDLETERSEATEASATSETSHCSSNEETRQKSGYLCRSEESQRRLCSSSNWDR